MEAAEGPASFPGESIQKLHPCAVPQATVHSQQAGWPRVTAAARRPGPCPGDGGGGTTSGGRQGRTPFGSVYLHCTPFTELIKHEISVHLLWNFRTLACPLQQSTSLKQQLLKVTVEALILEEPSPPLPWKQQWWDLCLSWQERPPHPQAQTQGEWQQTTLGLKERGPAAQRDPGNPGSGGT